MMQNLYFGTGSEARWLEGGSRFPADLVPRTLARQQQVPKMEPTFGCVLWRWQTQGGTVTLGRDGETASPQR